MSTRAAPSTRRKYRIADEVMAGVPGYRGTRGGLSSLWLPVEDGRGRSAQALARGGRARVLPGHYLARETAEGTPGADRIRVALVAEKEENAPRADPPATDDLRVRTNDRWPIRPDKRDPFLDQETHAILVRRGQEMLGLVLLGLGVALAALMLSYTPDDPNWMAATDTVPQNLLGRTGASVAAILMMIVGYGALVLPIASLVWGVRFLLHAGADRALAARVLPADRSGAGLDLCREPRAAAGMERIPSVWAGLFGDTVLGAVLNALPISAQAGLKLVAAAAFLGGAAMLFSRRGRQRGGVPRRHAVPDLWAAGVRRRWSPLASGAWARVRDMRRGAYKRRGSPRRGGPGNCRCDAGSGGR